MFYKVVIGINRLYTFVCYRMGMGIVPVLLYLEPVLRHIPTTGGDAGRAAQREGRK